MSLIWNKGSPFPFVIFKNLTVNQVGNVAISLTSQQYLENIAAFLIDHQPYHKHKV